MKTRILAIVVVLVGIGIFGWGTFQFLAANNQQTVNNQLSGEQTQVSSMPPSLTASSIDKSEFKVARVIDGDTIELETGVRVRYIGIDTPETVDPRKEMQCFGQEAKEKNQQLVEGKMVKLEKDVSETDKYGRLLRYVYVDNVFINEYLVKEGFAKVSTYPPDVKYQEIFRKAETEARNNKKGLWGEVCNNQNSGSAGLMSNAASQNSLGMQQVKSDCAIKGNISSNGEKIYHLPGQRYYDKTKIDESLGEQWFCSEEEAVNAGWRKSKI